VGGKYEAYARINAFDVTSFWIAMLARGQWGEAFAKSLLQKLKSGMQGIVDLRRHQLIRKLQC
jgi:hypothetical protein